MPEHSPLILSPSQYNQYDPEQEGGCPRKWAWRYLMGIKVPEKKGTATGTRTHKQKELYLNGMSLDYSTPAMREAAEIAIPGMVNLPAPLDPPSTWPIPEEEQVVRNAIMRIEQPFSIAVLDGPSWRGVKDVEVPDSIVIPGCGGGRPGVIDHKSTKAARYVKTPGDLREDTQANVYAKDAMDKYNSPSVDVVYNYVFTEGARRTQRVHLIMYRDQAEDIFSQRRLRASEIDVIYKERPSTLDLPYNKAACRSFGGCPYIGLCTDLNSGPMGHLTPEEEANMTQSGLELFARIEASNKAEDKATTDVVPGVSNVPEGFTIPPFLMPQRAVPTTHFVINEPANAVVAINPPESTLPPMPMVTSTIATDAPPTEKAKRMRRTKAQIEADNATEIAKLLPPERVAEIQQELTEKAKSEDEAQDRHEHRQQRQLDTGFTLYVDCSPQNMPVTDAAGFIAAAKRIVQEELKVADYRFVDYGKGQGALVSAFAKLTENITGDIFIDSRTPEGLLVLGDLTARASYVVRGIR